MKLNIAYDARPQIRVLLTAAAITVLLWFIPFAEFLTYPFRIFVTFIHEGGHALAAVLTGNSVHSLQIFKDASGVTYATRSGLISDFVIASSGYLGAMAYGALLLILIRRSIAARIVLIGTAALILGLTLIYGLSSLFTIFSGLFISLGLILAAKRAGPRLASFLVSFLAVQSLLNAILDLKTVLFLSSPFGPNVHTDALNMANATGIPAIFWALLWAFIAFILLSIALRAYAVSDKEPIQQDLPFDDSKKA
jgi:hypothetical protein